ncbi:MAG: hypothetical protein IJS01_15065 [Lentisphaeria bacterium]|nr:hypothetical protein [Lentisphaeria bacterium]
MKRVLCCFLPFAAVLAAGEVSFGAFDPVSEKMTVKTPQLVCRFLKYHAFPAEIVLADGRKVPFFDFGDELLPGNGKTFFRTGEDYWSGLSPDPGRNSVTARAVFCRRRWKPYPEVFPGTSAEYVFGFSGERAEIRLSCTVKDLPQEDVKLALLVLRWPLDRVGKYVLSPDGKRLALTLSGVSVTVEAEGLTVAPAGAFFRIAPVVTRGEKEASARLVLKFK